MFIDSQNVFMGTSRQETFPPETIQKKLKINKEQSTSEVVVTNGETTWSGTLPPAGKRGRWPNILPDFPTLILTITLFH